MNTLIPIDEVFLILTGKISSMINRTILRAFAAEKLDVTTEQWTVLACLWKEDKVTQQFLCNMTSKDKPSMTHLIDNLEKRNLVTRVSDPKDRRINLIHLTKNGIQLQSKATEVIQRVIEKTLRDINEAELEMSKNILKKIISNIE